MGSLYFSLQIHQFYFLKIISDSNLICSDFFSFYILQDHPAALSAFSLREEKGPISITDHIYRKSGAIRMRALSNYFLRGKGPLASTACDHGAYMTTAGPLMTDKLNDKLRLRPEHVGSAAAFHPIKACMRHHMGQMRVLVQTCPSYLSLAQKLRAAYGQGAAAQWISILFLSSYPTIIDNEATCNAALKSQYYICPIQGD